MLTGQLRNEVDKLWETFWTGGITNPLTVIEQITYLLFLRRLDQQQLLKEKQASELDMPITDPIYPEEATPLRWSSFKNLDPEAMIDRFTRGITLNGEQTNVFDYMKQLAPEDTAFANHMKGATFMISTPRLLDRAVQLIDKLDMDDRDTKGDLYEYLLSKIASAGQNGQFRTPRHIIQLMVDMTLPTPTDTICDPSAGTCGFLVAADEYLRREHQDEFYKKEFRAHYNSAMFNGLEFDSSMMRIGAMNLMLHGIERPNLLHVDALSEENAGITDRYSLMLANPPFKGSLDGEYVANDLKKMVNTKKTELLFLALMLRMLRPGGRAAVIVPDGVLFGSSRAHKAIREAIVEEHQLQGVVSMPSGVFKPYAGVSTAILLFTKTNSGGTDQVWFYDMQADGYSLDDKRSELGRRMPEQPEKLAKDEHLFTLTDPHGQVIEYRVQKHGENNIPDILHRWRTPEDEAERPRTAQSFYVPVQEIRDNAYDLSINRYKEIEYEAVAYDPPQELLARIRKMEAERAQLMQELENLLD